MGDMPRKARIAPGGFIYHVFNRATGKLRLFGKETEYAAFEDLLIEAHQRHSIRLLAYCLTPNQWNFVVWPKKDHELSAFFRWLTHTHAMRARVARHIVGEGQLYQGRYKNFPIQRNGHLLTVSGFVERQALAAGLVKRAEKWRWSSLWAREHGSEALQSILPDWPVDRPANWVKRLNEPIEPDDLSKLETCLKRSRPFGDDRWTAETVRRLHLEHTVRREGRPAKTAQGGK